MARSISNQLRQAIARSGMTRYAIAKASGVTESTLCRFMVYGEGISIDNIDRLAPVLGLRIIADVKTGAKSVTRQTASKRKQKTAKGR